MTAKAKAYGNYENDEIEEWFTVGSRVSTVYRTLAQKLNLKDDCFNVQVINIKENKKYNAFVKKAQTFGSLKAYRDPKDDGVHFYFSDKGNLRARVHDEVREQEEYSSEDEEVVHPKVRSYQNPNSDGKKKAPLSTESDMKEVEKLEHKLFLLTEMLNSLKKERKGSLPSDRSQPVLNVSSSGMMNIHGPFYQFGSITAASFTTVGPNNSIPPAKYIKDIRTKNVDDSKKTNETEKSIETGKKLKNTKKNTEKAKELKNKVSSIGFGKKDRLTSTEIEEKESESEFESDENNMKTVDTAKDIESEIDSEVTYEEWLDIIGVYFVALLNQWGYDGAKVINFVGAQQYLLRLYETTADSCGTLQESIDTTLSKFIDLSPKELKEFVVNLDNFILQ
eukprot:TRINITY_DN2032_c0_g1_i1.p1 TRINITY_DN2032_c0_g1~~TRINITY_DN2032_c0_g1_i1.p1  ORF type:complete len:404 (-),score=127.64 TRINITY_DN2032_c0_g1_i1:68-1246(-)